MLLNSISTNAVKSSILNYPQDPSCRLCHCFPEKTFHLLSACLMLAETEHLKRHNSVASLVNITSKESEKIRICA